LLGGLIALSPAPLDAVQNDEADALRATQELEIQALHARDVDAYLDSLHPEEVSMFVWDAFPIDYKGRSDERRRAVESFFANVEHLRITSFDKHYRVVGDTGLVWGYAKLEMKPRDGPLEIRNVRGLWVYVRVDGEWLRIARHVSPIPEGN
jgi:ketosteroid isomerase-like protein